MSESQIIGNLLKLCPISDTTHTVNPIQRSARSIPLDHIESWIDHKQQAMHNHNSFAGILHLQNKQQIQITADEIHMLNVYYQNGGPSVFDSIATSQAGTQIMLRTESYTDGITLRIDNQVAIALGFEEEGDTFVINIHSRELPTNHKINILD